MPTPRLRALAGALALAAVVLPVPAAAQKIVDDSTGTLELIGLKRWSYRMLEDSLARYAPGESLRSHACQAVLQQKLHFPSASVQAFIGFLEPGSDRTATIVTVVEPQDSARVRRRTFAGPPGLRVAAWRDIHAALTFADTVGDTVMFQPNAVPFLMQFYEDAVTREPDGTLTVRRGRDVLPGGAPEGLEKAAGPFWNGIARRNDPGSMRRAIATLRADANVENRLVAASILRNFPARDEAWHALVGALRDEEDRVQSTAAQALASMSRRAPRRVDWRPATDDLRALLGGTNVGQFRELVTMLDATKIDGALAAPLLAGNGDLLLAVAAAEFRPVRDPARALLARLSGQASATPGEWARWIATLKQDGR